MNLNTEEVLDVSDCWVVVLMFSEDSQGSDLHHVHQTQSLSHLIFSAGDRVPAGELDWTEPQWVRRTGPGGFLQGPEGEEGAGLLPV